MRGRRWNAEWEPQESVWFTLPHNHQTFDGKLDAVMEYYQHLIQLISKHQKVFLNIEPQLDSNTRKLFSGDSVQMFEQPSNDLWCRDHGATFVTLDNGELLGIDWKYNAWGGKFPPWELDTQIASSMCNAIGVNAEKSSIFLEGGAIEGNGNGVVITTESVVLNPNRNPNITKLEAEAELKLRLGAEHIFWLAQGIEGDDTDGHVDDLTRFIKEDAIVTAIDTNQSSQNYRVLEENKERLGDLKTRLGSSVEIIDLPMPDSVSGGRNWRLTQLPASYANFLILNKLVLVPTFNQPKNDDRALGILRECFPKRQIIGLDSRALLKEGGTLHCISQQQPQI